MKCGLKCEIYSRVCGYFRPVSNWNKGKKEEFKDRKTYDVGVAANGDNNLSGAAPGKRQRV